MLTLYHHVQSPQITIYIRRILKYVLDIRAIPPREEDDTILPKAILHTLANLPIPGDTYVNNHRPCSHIMLYFLIIGDSPYIAVLVRISPPHHPSDFRNPNLCQYAIIIVVLSSTMTLLLV